MGFPRLALTLPFWPPLLCLVVAAVAPPARAQITETPYTIAPGKFVGRLDLLSLTLDRHDPDESGKPFSAQAVARTQLATGLTENLDLEVGLDWFYREKFNLRGAHDSRSGVGSVRLRSKYTFWRDRTIPAAAAVVPYVRIPTRRNGVGSGAVEGGIIVPWGTGAPGGTTFGAMAEWDFVRNDDDTGYDSVWYVAGLLNRPLTKSVSLYGEASLAVSSASAGDWAMTLGGGANWQVTDRTRVDFSLHRNLARATSGWNPMLRVNWEF